MEKKIRILIADDHAIMREGLVTLLRFRKEFAVVGEANNGREALKKSLELRPDVIIMDLMMPQMNGAEATAQLKQRLPDTKVLVLTSYTDASNLVDALKNGASGALAKTLTKEELFAAIHDVVDGKRVISKEIQPALQEDLSGTVLTPRQREVMESLTRGLTYEEIARQLSVTKACVKFHVLTILRKLGVANRSEAVALALRKHLLKN